MIVLPRLQQMVVVGGVNPVTSRLAPVRGPRSDRTSREIAIGREIREIL